MAGLYWIGLAMTLSCFAVVLASNTELIWRFEHRALPLSWILAGGAVLAFLAAELYGTVSPHASASEAGSSELSPEFEAAEF
jgi:hypothetical protein